MAKNTLNHKSTYELCNFISANHDRFNGMTLDEVASICTETLSFTVCHSNIKTAAKTLDVTWDGLKFKKKLTADGKIDVLARALDSVLSRVAVDSEDRAAIKKMASS